MEYLRNLNDLYTGKVVKYVYPRNEIFFKKEEGEALAELGLAGKTVYALYADLERHKQPRYQHRFVWKQGQGNI